METISSTNATVSPNYVRRTFMAEEQRLRQA